MSKRLPAMFTSRSGGRFSSRTGRSLVWLSLALICGPEAGFGAGAVQGYAEGKEAVARRQWQAAVRYLTQAAEAEPEEKGSRWTGLYLPHYYLGISLFSLGDCGLAGEHLARSRKDGAVLGTRHMSELRRVENACSTRSKSERQVRRDIDSASRLADQVAARSADPQLADYWSRGLPSPGVQLRESRRVLEQAERLLAIENDLELAAGQVLRIHSTTEQQIEDSRRLTSQVIELLENLDTSADEHLALQDRLRQALRNEVLDLRLTAVHAWGSAYRPERKDATGRDLASEYQRVANLHLGNEDATLEELEEVKAELADFLDAVAELPRRPRYRAPTQTPLRLVAEAYFAGQYRQVLTLLEGADLSSRRDRAHLYLFRAAALYSLYLIGDEPDPDLLSDARRNIRGCLDASPGLEPSTDAFSPRFVGFFQEQSALLIGVSAVQGGHLSRHQEQPPRAPGSR